MTLETLVLSTALFVYGIVIGSFLNVCICRIPNHESIVKVPSHCTHCGKRIMWYDLVPLFSYLFLKGKCRNCKEHISIQYPIIEVLNGVLYVVIYLVGGFTVATLLYCLLASALIVISVIDWKTQEIPPGLNWFIGCLGIVRLVTDLSNWHSYVIGFFAVSGFLYLLFLATKGRGIGGGDVKLMAVCGLLLGWKGILFGFFVGCILGALIHTLRMRFSGAGRVLAMGPYLSIGVLLAALWGNLLMDWYMGMVF